MSSEGGGGLDAIKCLRQGSIGALGAIPGTMCAHPMDVLKIRCVNISRCCHDHHFCLFVFVFCFCLLSLSYNCSFSLIFFHTSPRLTAAAAAASVRGSSLFFCFVLFVLLSPCAQDANNVLGKLPQRSPTHHVAISSWWKWWYFRILSWSCASH